MTNQLEITLEVILHATEDDNKIFGPINDLFQIQKEEFTIERILGHYGNSITLAKAKLTKKQAEGFIKKLTTKITKSQRDELISNLEMHFEDTSLFLRIGKNELVNGQINLHQDNALKIKVKMPIYKKEQMKEKYIELLSKTL